MLKQITNIQKGLSFRIEAKSSGVDYFNTDPILKDSLDSFLNSTLGMIAGTIESKNLQILKISHSTVAQLCTFMTKNCRQKAEEISNGDFNLKRYHAHVYKVTALQEFDVEQPDSEHAKQFALDKAKANPQDFKDPECEYIVLIWDK